MSGSAALWGGGDKGQIVVAKLSRIAERQLPKAHQAFAQTKGELAKVGLLNSGRRVIVILRQLSENMIETTGEIFRTINDLQGRMNINQDTYIDDAEGILKRHLDSLVEAAPIFPNGLPSPAVEGAVEAEIGKIRNRLSEDIEEFRNGVWTGAAAPQVVAPEERSTNTTVVYGNVGGSIVQGGPGSSQTSYTHTNVGEAARTITVMETLLSTAEVNASAQDEILSDLHTIKAQLRKSQPNRAILVEAGEALKQVSLGVASNILTPYFLALFTALNL